MNRSSGPSRSTSSPRPTSNKNPQTSASSSETAFTRANQDQQARNKEPDDGVYEDDSSDDEMGQGYDLFGNEAYELVKLRREAVSVLDNPELLMMHAQARNDSIPSTRLHFLKLLAGRPPTPMQELQASERRLAHQKRLAKERELADAGMVEIASSSRAVGAGGDGSF